MEHIRTEAVIFDLDGVLVSTDQFHYLAWKRLADQLGIYFDQEINSRCRGISRRDSLEVLLERSPSVYSEKEKEAFLVLKNEWYREYLKEMTPLQVDNNVQKTLKILRDKGYKLAVGSSSRNAGLILEKTGLLYAFDAISDGNHIKRSKPDPEVFLKAASIMKVRPEACLVVEDAVSGLIAAHAGGMKAAAVGEAAYSEHADYPLRHLAELPAVLEAGEVRI